MTTNWLLLDGEALARLTELPDESVDALITDPPYSSGGMFRGDRAADTATKYEQGGQKLQRHAFEGDAKDQRSWTRWCCLWLSECRRVLRPGAPVCLFTDWRQLPATTDVLQLSDFVWRGIAPWDKGQGTRPTLGRPRSQCEYIAWGSKGPMPIQPEIGALPGALTEPEGESFDLQYIHEPVRQADKHHLTGKPTKVMRWLARMCPIGGTVLDPFAGSASTGVGALLEGRSFLGVERDVTYHEVARVRLEGAARGEQLSVEQVRGILEDSRNTA